MRKFGWTVVFSFISAFVFSANETEVKIGGSYSGKIISMGATYTISIPSLPVRTLVKYQNQKFDKASNGFIVDIETDASNDLAERRLYIFQNHWTFRKPTAPEQYDTELASGQVDYYAPRGKIGVTIQIPASLIDGTILEAVDYRDTRARFHSKSAKVQINLVTVTIKQGFISTYPPKNKFAPYDVRQNPDYLKNKRLAEKAGFNIDTVFDWDFVAHYNGEYFFLLYYNKAEAIGTKYDYLLQRVKITQKFLDKNGEEIRPTTYRYLVEAFKLNGFKQMKGTDRHHKCYSLDGAYKRETTVDIEIGEGTIPRLVKGHKWPFKSSILYYAIQDYNPEPKLYDKVVFENSKVYSYYFEFDADGKFDVRHTD